MQMGAEKLLTEAACKAAKSKTKLYCLNEVAGLRLRVRPDRSRWWIYRYRLANQDGNQEGQARHNLRRLEGSLSKASGRSQQIKPHDFGVAGVDMCHAVTDFHVI